MSRFQQLVRISEEDYDNTYEYLRRNFDFINQIASKLAQYIECDLHNISFVDSEGKLNHPNSFIQNSISIDNDCFFNFKLLVSVNQSGFCLNNSGKSFAERGLTPPLGVILLMSVKQDGNSFIVKAPGIETQQSKSEVTESEFTINPDCESQFDELLKNSFKIVKTILKEGLEGRINALREPKESSTQPAFGFRF